MILLSGSNVSASALMMSPASRRRSRQRRATQGARTDLELADAGRVLAARALEEAAGLGDHPLVVEGLRERLRARGRWGASSTDDHRRRCYTSRTIWFVIVACACGLRAGVRGRGLAAAPCARDASLRQQREGVRCAALMGRAAMALDAGTDTHSFVLHASTMRDKSVEYAILA